VRRVFAGALLAALLSAAQAEDSLPDVAVPPPAAIVASPGALQVPPQRMGYAFDRPEILIRQRLFGLAHGLSVLAGACLDLPEHSEPIQEAYAAWHATQGKTIDAIQHDLAVYYFGERAAEARWQDLARALILPDNIQAALGRVSLQDACASLPDAIARPRYELDRLLAEVLEPKAKPEPPVAVPPAPTISPTAE
jgi:hypothetical protein